MILVYIAAPLLLLGVTMWIRGMVYTLKPEGSMAQKRKRRNLKLGFTTDMKIFGRKVRRLGFMISIVAGGLLAWHFSDTKNADGTAGADAPSVENAAPAGELPSK